MSPLITSAWRTPKRAHGQSRKQTSDRYTAAHGEHVEAGRLAPQARQRSGLQQRIRGCVADGHRQTCKRKQEREPPKERIERDENYDQATAHSKPRADPSSVAGRINGEQSNGAKQAARAEGADRDAEVADITVQHVLDEDRTKHDERSAERARQQNREQCTTQAGRSAQSPLFLQKNVFDRMPPRPHPAERAVAGSKLRPR